MFCMNCGKTLPDGAKFCKFCGTPQDATLPTGSTSTFNGITTDSLLQRAEIMLMDGNFSDAREKCDTVLDADPTNSKAYLFKLMAALHVKRQDDLADCSQPFDNNNFYLKALQFGDEETKSKLVGYIDHINERNRMEHIKGIYNKADLIIANAITEKECYQAIELFKSISDFEDSNERIEECLSKIEAIKAEAIKQEAREAEKRRIAEEKAGKLNKVLIISLLIIVIAVLIPTVIIPALRLNKAKRLMESGEYDSAYALLADLGKTDEIDANKYDRAITLINSEDYESAYALLEELGKTDEITANKYDRAITLINSGDYVAAYVLIKEIGKMDEFKAYKHDIAIALINTSDYEAAYDLLEELGEFSEIKRNKYDRAIAAINSSDYETAYVLLKEIEPFSDSSNQLEKIEPMYYKIQLSKAEVGDTVHFGFFEQDDNAYDGKEFIEWIVLAKEGDNILVTSKYALDYISYHNTDEEVTWSQCYLRSWLNEDFYNESFDSDDQKRILDTMVKTDNPTKEEETMDKVFLLSITEVKTYYISEISRCCVATKYAKTKNDDYYYYTVWYLRNSGNDPHSVAYVNNLGKVEYENAFDSDTPCAVRPAMWISTVD